MHLGEHFRMLAHRSPVWNTIDVHIIREDFTARPVTVEALRWMNASGDLYFDPIEEGTLPPPAPFRLTFESAQSLMDDLYRAGLRPQDSKATDGHLGAMQAHLEDMRTLVFRGQQ